MHKYQKVKKLGEGASGTVYKAKILEPGESKKRKSKADGQEEGASMIAMDGDDVDDGTAKFVAIKKIKMGDQKLPGLPMDAIRELKLLPELSHTNLIKIMDVFNSESNINLVLEYMAGDTLSSIIRSPHILTSGDRKAYMHMLLSGTAYLHDNWVLHRDIKPDNLLIGTDGTLKLTDFGLAKIFGSPDRSLSPEACTIHYRAPELLFGARSYGPGADMWSVGCVMAELMLRAPFFPGGSQLDQLGKIFQKMGTPTEEDWEGMTMLPCYTEFKPCAATPLRDIFTASGDDELDLLASLLRFDPSRRITARQALSHPYFSNNPPPTPIANLPKASNHGHQ